VVHRCPAHAIRVSVGEGEAQRHTMEWRTMPEDDEPVASD
jgi:hypothetical protein